MAMPVRKWELTALASMPVLQYQEERGVDATGHLLTPTVMAVMRPEPASVKVVQHPSSISKLFPMSKA